MLLCRAVIFNGFFFRSKARYNFSHEILEADQSVFHGEVIPRQRRISIILRKKPDMNDINT